MISSSQPVFVEEQVGPWKVMVVNEAGERAYPLRGRICSLRGPDSVPSTHNKQFTTACNSASRAFSFYLLASEGTRTHLHIPLPRHTEMHLIKHNIF